MPKATTLTKTFLQIPMRGEGAVGWLGLYVLLSPFFWYSWLTVDFQATFVVHALTILSLTNAFYTFWRRRHYRLFENDVNVAPSTPSAHRVRVDSSPISSPPLRYLADILATSTAQARSHPDAARDVWELRIWDPTPICLRLFCLFSPGHVFVYWLYLPLDSLDPRPSVTATKALILNLLLTVQLLLLQTSFSQQAKDAALIHKEVHNEYDIKYVHPATQRPVRDVSTQCLTSRTPSSTHEVLVSTPKTYVNRGFNPHPNPTYASHYDPDRARSPHFTPREPTRSVTTPNIATPAVSTNTDFSSPIRSTPGPIGRQPQFRPSTGAGEGGYLGVHSHAQSPLRKQALLGSEQSKRMSAGANELRHKSPGKRESSPLKRSSMPDMQQRFGQVRPDPLGRRGGR